MDEYVKKFVFGHDSPQWARASSFTRFLDHTQRRTTVGRTSSGRVISPTQRPLPDNTQHSQQTDTHGSGGIRTHNISRRAASDPRFRPRGHWDPIWYDYVTVLYNSLIVLILRHQRATQCFSNAFGFFCRPKLFWGTATKTTGESKILLALFTFFLKKKRFGPQIFPVSHHWLFICASTTIVTFLVNDHLDAQFFSMCLFQFSTCFEQPRAHHQENQLYQYNIW